MLNLRYQANNMKLQAINIDGKKVESILEVSTFINTSTSEIIHISPIKNSDLIIAANVNIKSISLQMSALKSNFYLIFLIALIIIKIITGRNPINRLVIDIILTDIMSIV